MGAERTWRRPCHRTFTGRTSDASTTTRRYCPDRYHRGGNVSGIVGTGVGLYLVKMVVDMHGGAVTVDSKEGEGARFSIRLPRKPAAATQTAAIAEAPWIAAPPDALQSVLSRTSE